jgi:hypothetical protein
MRALGGISSPAGSCVWHVVGLQRSVREWAMRQGWSGRPVRQEQAQGILVAALGVLAGHFSYERAAWGPVTQLRARLLARPGRAAEVEHIASSKCYDQPSWDHIAGPNGCVACSGPCSWHGRSPRPELAHAG